MHNSRPLLPACLLAGLFISGCVSALREPIYPRADVRAELALLARAGMDAQVDAARTCTIWRVPPEAMPGLLGFTWIPEREVWLSEKLWAAPYGEHERAVVLVAELTHITSGEQTDGASERAIAQFEAGL